MLELLLIDEEEGHEEPPPSDADAASTPPSPPPPCRPVPRSKSVGRRKLALDLHRARYLSMSDFARFAGMGRSTVWRLVRAGRIRSIRISQTLVRIPVTELERLGKQPVTKLADTNSVIDPLSSGSRAKRQIRRT
jgi:excisionase family DNA binding protein